MREGYPIMKTNRLIPTMLLPALWLGAAVQQGQAQQPASIARKTEAPAGAISKINPSILQTQAPRVSWSGFRLRNPSRHPNGTLFNVTPAGALQTPAVLGSGTVGKLSIWTGTGPSGNSLLGDSIITQSGDNIG